MPATMIRIQMHVCKVAVARAQRAQSWRGGCRRPNCAAPPHARAAPLATRLHASSQKAVSMHTHLADAACRLLQPVWAPQPLGLAFYRPFVLSCTCALHQPSLRHSSHVQSANKSVQDPDPEAAKRQAQRERQQAPQRRAYRRTDDERGLMMNCIMAAVIAILSANSIARSLLITTAVSIFNVGYPDSNASNSARGPRYLAKDVFERMANNADLRDQPRGRPPSQLNDAKLDALIVAFKGGFHDQQKRFWGFTSPMHAANTPGHFQQLLADTGLSVKHVWSCMQSRHVITHGRSMRKISIHIKPMLSAHVKLARLQKAKEWVKRGTEFLMNCVWIDEKQEYITPGGKYSCYAPDDVKSFGRPDTNDFAKKTKVKWIMAVSARLGCVYFKLVTGTTGMKSEYVVRT